MFYYCAVLSKCALYSQESTVHAFDLPTQCTISMVIQLVIIIEVSIYRSMDPYVLFIFCALSRAVTMAEAGDDKLESHLKRHGLTDPKWLTMFKKMKVNDPDIIDEKERKFEMLSLPANPTEIVSLRRALGIFDPSARDRVDEVLIEAGLEDVEYWSRVLMKQFGVSSAQGLYHIPDFFYPHLVHFSRSMNEKRSLRRLLKVENDEINMLESHQKYLTAFKERTSELLAMIDRFEMFKREKRELEDEEVKIIWHNFLESLQVPKCFWLSDNSFDSFIRSIKTFHDLLMRAQGAKKPLDLVAKASNGLALKGILIEGGNEIRVMSVLSDPEEIVFQPPLYSQHIKYYTCIGKDEEWALLEGIEGLEQSMPKVPQRRGRGYSSSIRCFVLPLALCYFKPEQLKLSAKAIEELNLLSSANTRPQFQHFLREYGSHVCLGPFHFGGSYRWRCASSESASNAAKALQNRTISYMSGIAPQKWLQKVCNANIPFSSNYSKDLRENTHIVIKPKGGPQTLLPFAFWKNFLVMDRDSWEIVQCGRDYYPIWDIVEMNHPHDFDEPALLAKGLKEAWEELNGSKCYESVITDAKKLEEKVIHGWVEAYNPSKCVENLQSLIQKRRSIRNESGDIEVWPKHYLSLPKLQRFLKMTMKSSSECDNVKCVMRQVVGLIDLGIVPEFPNRESFQQWLFESDQQSEMHEYNDLMLHVEFCFKLANDKIPSGTGDNEAFLELLGDPETNLSTTVIIQNTLGYLQKYFHMKNMLYDELYIATLLFPFKYDFGINTIYLTSSDISYLHELFEKHTKIFFKVKSFKNTTKLQAYIIQLSIEICKDLGMDASYRRVTGHFTMIFEVLEDIIDENIGSILDKVLSMEVGIDMAQLTLERIVQCSHDSEIAGEVEFVMLQAAKALKQTNIAKDFEMMLSVFDMQCMYPQKLTLLESVQVREVNVDTSNICSNGKLYPSLIIQKIMSFDHRCFIRLAKSATQSMPRSKRRELKVAEFVAREKGRLIVNINPLDGLITVLLCADNFLRQDLMCRLAICQNAVPLILPDPMTQSLTLTLWGMRSIIKQWKVKFKKDDVYEVPIITHPTPIITFMRFGALHRSKSNLINIIMNDSGHNTFFHYDCDGGSARKIIAEGLVEIAWYLPSSTSKSFNEAITFLNLRGDARNFQRQTNFLSEIALMHFVLLDEGAVDDIGFETLRMLSKAPGGVVLLHDPKAPGGRLRFKEIKPKTNCIILELNHKNEADTKADIRDKIASCIDKHWRGKSVSRNPPRYQEAACSCGIHIDEKEEECTEGKTLAYTFQKIVERVGNPKDHLELQGGKLWHHIALKEKERFRQRESHKVLVSEHTEGILNDILSLRKEQLRSTENIHENALMNSFLTSLLALSGKKVVRNYYIRWLKFLLDNLSREKLPPLHREYHQKRAELHKAKESSLESCKKELEKLNTTLINASFGLEHLLREVGQVYEATALCSDRYNHLPSIVADILIDGYPLELMDGDAAHVPMRWVTAVLQEVKEKLNNPLILVLSILGIQSTGKSTLLNTLFGVNFNVSAGRCTRGAFMQLLPVHSSARKIMKCQYLLLVDTEGLRAPELDATQTHNHDNQLATFVIGLASLTLINIYGEVSADMNDVLQTVVHAFLRMKQVTSNPGCHFVYQNVTGVMAGDKGMMGRGKTKATLDKITRAAAEEESLEKVYCFNDVIKFDDEKDVSYFPSLWFGNPPMAPVNPDYSRHARMLRNEIVRYGSPKKKHCIITFSKFIDYLKLFWDAILHENFVFSFKNSFEILAFSVLDSQRSKWYWSFQKDMMTLEDNFETEVCNSGGRVYEKAKEKLFAKATKKYSQLIEEMDIFFEESSDREILINWKAETERLLKRLHDELINRSMQYCERVWQERRAQEALNEIKGKCHHVISGNVKVLVADLDGKEPLKEDQLWEKFEEQWKEWVKELEKTQNPHQEETQNIEMDIQGALYQHFEHRLSRTLRKKLDPSDGGKSLEKWGETLKLEIEEWHIKDTQQRNFLMQLMVSFKAKYHWQLIAEKETMYFLDEVSNYLSSRRNKDYNPTFITELLKLLQDEIGGFHNEEFQFSLDYRMDMALTSCGYALPKFKEMAIRYRNKRNPVKNLETEKKRYFQHFNDSYRRTAQEIIAARHCCEVVKGAVERRVIKSLCVTVVEKMEKDESNSFLFTKPALIRKVLASIGIELGKNNFEMCYQYLQHPMKTLRDYIKSHTETYCDYGEPVSRLTEYARELLTEVMKFVKVEVANTNNNHKGTFIILEWIAQFKKRASQRLIIEDTMAIQCLLDSEEKNHSMEVFIFELKKGLDCIQKDLENNIKPKAKDMEEWGQKPYNIIFNRVSGCTEACPFCREPCSNTSKNHEGDHTVKLHRPQCLGGWRRRSSGKMALLTCTEAVAKDLYFYKSRTDEKHPFRTCEEVYEKWHIQEDLPGETSLFWKYVVAHFKSELARLYNMEEESVPDHWMAFELSQAIEAL